MKYSMVKIVAAIAIVCMVTPAAAHIYEFSNHTHYDIKIRIQLSGVKEPWYYHDIPAKGYREFRFVAGEGVWDDMRKVGFCLQNIQIATPRIKKVIDIDDDGNQVVKYEPVLDSSGKPAFNPWRNVVVTWVENEAYNSILKAADAFADGATELAVSIVRAMVPGAQMLPSFKVSGITGAVGTWIKYSFCAGRHFDIGIDADSTSETEKNFLFFTEARG
jgi:hypothetical protein